MNLTNKLFYFFYKYSLLTFKILTGCNKVKIHICVKNDIES